MSRGETPEERALARFESLLERCEQLRTAGLPFDELRELARLYRGTSARLARLRGQADDPEQIRYLNSLCARAYAHITVSPTDAAEAPLIPRLRKALARTWQAQPLAWAPLGAGMYVGAALVARSPEAAHAFIPSSLGFTPSMIDRLMDAPEARGRFLRREATPAGANVFFGSQLFANNTRVGLLAFASGLLAAVPTILMAVYNGAMLGAFGRIFLQDPYEVEFLAWILPHGIPEFTAIALCVAGGLLLGGAVAPPGRRYRRDAIREALDPALLLFVASIPLFVLAALIESFVRESALGLGPRFAAAGAMGLLVAAGLPWSRRLARASADRGWLSEVIAPARSGSPGSG